MHPSRPHSRRRPLLAAAHPHEGAIVAADVRTGRILVWASRGAGRDLVAAPFAPSASLFKMVTASALIERGVSPSTRQCYEGGEHAIEEGDIEDRPGPGADQ